MPNPGQILNIGTGDGQNHFNVGIGRPSGHTDYSPATIQGGYSSDPEFISTPDGLAVQFRVRMDAETTSSGTQYPRSELREYDESGTAKAAWDGSTGNHYMEGISRVTHLQPVKPWVVFCQIHDASSDLIRVQTEGTSTSNLKLVARNTPPGSSSETVTTVQASYTLGDDIHWRLEVIDGDGTLYLGGVAVLSFPADTDGLYFKAGAYAQSNDTIDAASEYSAVELRNLVHWHSGWPTAQGSGTDTGGGGTPETSSFTMAFASCINASDSDAFDAIAALGPDFFYMAGDCWYDDGSSGHLAHWNAKFSAPKYAAMLAGLPNPQIVGWSDHDSTFQSNGTGLQYPSVMAAGNADYRTKFPETVPDIPATSGIYRKFQVGRVTFVLCDERTFKSPNSATDNSSKTMLGSTQKAWLKAIVANPPTPVIVILGDSPVIGSTTAGDDSWKGYNTERQELAAAYNASSATIIRLSGDMHCLAYSHNRYGVDRAWQAAPLNNNSKVKAGGEELDGSYPSNANEGAVEQLFGAVEFTDDGSQITCQFTGYDTDGTVRLSDSITVSAPGGTPPGGGGTPPTYAISNVRVAQTAIVGNTATNPALPAGLVAGDLLLMRDTVIRFSTGSQPATPGTPAGWTRKATEASPAGAMQHASIRYTWMYARYDPTGVNGVSSAPTVPYSGIAGDEHHTQITACTGAWATGDPTDVLGTFGVRATTSSTQIGPAPGITTTADGGLVLGIIASEYDTTGGIGNWSGESLAWGEDDEHGNGTANTWAYGYDHALIPTARTIADKYLSCSVNTAGKSVGQMWAIKPQPDRVPVAGTRAASWQVKARAAAARTMHWAVKASVTTTGIRVVRWRTRKAVGGTRVVTWASKLTAVAARTARWQARGRVIVARRARYRVKAVRLATRRARFNVRHTLAATRVVHWADRIRATAPTRAVRWSTRARLARTRRARWSVRALQPAARAARWRVRVTSGAASRAVSWSVRARAGATRVARWSLRITAVGAARALAWSVRTVATGPARAVRWRTHAPIAGARAVSWDTRGRAAATRTVSWGVRVSSGAAARVLAWDVRQRATASRQLRWLVTAPPVRVARAVVVRWSARAAVGDQVAARWDVRALAARTAATVWDARARTAGTRRVEWAVRATAGQIRRSRWTVRALAGSQRVARWNTRATALGAAQARWAARGLAGTARVAEWAVRRRVLGTRAGRWSVRGMVARTRTARWSVRALAAGARSASWAVRARLGALRPARWRVAAAARAARVTAWDVRGLAGTIRAARWADRHTAGGARAARWVVGKVTRGARRVRWRIVTTADQALVPGRLAATAAEASRLAATSAERSTLTAGTDTSTSRLTASVEPTEEG